MKWQVTFSYEKRHCCPPSSYQIVKTDVVEADTAEQAEQSVVRKWQYHHKIEIKRVEEYNNDKRQQGK
jgi:hypothetical protein